MSFFNNLLKPLSAVVYLGLLLSAISPAQGQITLQFNVPTYVGNLGGYSKHLSYIREGLLRNYNQANGPSFGLIHPGWGLGVGMVKKDIYFGFYWQSHNYTTDTFSTPHIFNETLNQYRIEMRHVGVEAGKVLGKWQGMRIFGIAGLEAGAIRHLYQNESSTEWLSQRASNLSAVNNHSSIQLNLGLMAEYQLAEKWQLLIRTGWQTGQKPRNDRGSSGFWIIAPLASSRTNPPIYEDQQLEQFGATTATIRDDFTTPMRRIFLDFRLAYRIGDKD